MHTNQGLPSVILLCTFCTLLVANSVYCYSASILLLYVFFSDLAGVYPVLNSICGLFTQHIFVEYLQYEGTAQPALNFKKIIISVQCFKIRLGVISFTHLYFKSLVFWSFNQQPLIAHFHS